MKSSKPRAVSTSLKVTKSEGASKTSASSSSKEFCCSRTPFRAAYDRRDLPIRVEHAFRGPKLRWTSELAALDYQRLLPLFCEGLRDTQFPYDLVVEEGINQMIEGQPEKVEPVIPFVVQPLKAALRTKDSKIMIKVLKILQKLAKDVPGGGQALVPYYRQLLPVLGRYKTKNMNLGDGIEYGQWRNENLADLIEQTLRILETHGGPYAFINIRYVIPLYESCIGKC